MLINHNNQISTIINHNNAYGNAYNNTCNYFKKLVDLYNEMEAPYHQLSTSSKLQTVSTFDPIEEIKELNEIENTLQNWKEVLNSQTFNEEELLKLTRQEFINQIKLNYSKSCLNGSTSPFLSYNVFS